MYACDKGWWKIHLEHVRRTFTGALYTQWHTPDTQKFAEDNGLTAVPGKAGNALGEGYIRHGANSGHQAINLAYLLGATRIILLGYDMGATGRTHWFGDHPEGLTNGDYSKYVKNFDNIAASLEHEGVEVINCTRTTALYQFKKGTIDDVAGL